jgi:hypothetical protein
MLTNRATREQVAEHLDLSTRWLAVLVNEGAVPGPGPDRLYDLDACRYAYLEHLRQRVAERTAAG